MHEAVRSYGRRIGKPHCIYFTGIAYEASVSWIELAVAPQYYKASNTILPFTNKCLSSKSGIASLSLVKTLEIESKFI